MASWSEACDEQYEQCCRDCWTDDPPWPFTQGSWYHTCCCVLCQGEYMICEAACPVNVAVEVVFDLAQAAADYVEENPEIVVGTLVIIAGITLIATCGPGGAIVLVAV